MKSTQEFWKFHALGNDYIVVDPRHCQVSMTENNIRLICDRNHGVGSDGILYGPFEESGRIYLRIFNPDGGECEKSGNGLRIFAKYLHDQKYVEKDVFNIVTKAGVAQAHILDSQTGLIKMFMGKPSFSSEQIPVMGPPREVLNESLEVEGKEIKINCVSVGNPHCVVLMDEVSRENARAYGPAISTHPFFPARTNVQFMRVLDRHNIQIEIWERGAGYTLASGSSSCAAACVAQKMGLAQSPITVHMPGGMLKVEISPTQEIFLTGTARSILNGFFTSEFLAGLDMSSAALK